MHLALKLTGHPVGKLSSGNVVADLPGRDPTLAPILVACHLDSWDLATGAIDDGAGCAIVAAGALAAQNGGAPLRTIRVLWAGSEEPGGVGGDAYAAAHKGQPHALVMESDTGADKVWRVSFDLTEANGPLADRIVEALAPFGIVRGTSKANGGTNVEPIAKAARSGVIGLNQDMTRYFDIHHSPDDTLDKVDRDGLAQNVAVWTTVLRIVANEPGSIAGM
jgi:Zn-dependent M28 family amino/carboxypeptidase